MPIQDDMQRWPVSLGVKNHNELNGVAPSQHHAHYYRMIWDLLSRLNVTTQVRGPDLLCLVPFQVPVTLTVDRVGCSIPLVAAGNIRMGIYRDNGDIPDGGALLVEGGPQVAVLNKNEVAFPATQLEPGLYWLALLNDDGTCVFVTTDGNVALGGTLQARANWATPFGPLPNPCPVTVVEFTVPSQYVRVSSVP